MEKKKLTERQTDTYVFIKGYIKTYKVSPTIREIADGIGVASTAAAQGHVNALYDKGYIDMWPGRARTITIIKDITNTIKRENNLILEPVIITHSFFMTDNRNSDGS